MSSHYFVVPISTNRLSSFLALHYWQVYVLYTESRYPCLIMWSRTPDFSLVHLVCMGSVTSFVLSASKSSFLHVFGHLFYSFPCTFMTACCLWPPVFMESACSFPSLPVCSSSVFNNDNSCFRIAFNFM